MNWVKEPFIEIDDEFWKTILDVNLNGTIIFSQEVAVLRIAVAGGMHRFYDHWVLRVDFNFFP